MKFFGFCVLAFYQSSFVFAFIQNYRNSLSFSAVTYNNKQRLFEQYASSGKKSEAVSRRRKRRQQRKPDDQITSESDNSNSVSNESLASIDSSASLEDKFGLGNDQLRELMEQELPVPRENLATRKTIEEEKVDKDKAFSLPELNEFIREVGDSDTREKKERDVQDSLQASLPKIDRSNKEEYLRVIQLNPFADADESMFLEEYDIIPAIFGTGTLLNIPIPFLQTGHGVLLAITLLAALIYVPGNPLTEFPPEIRSFLKQGLLVTYTVNTILAIRAFQIAKSKNLPGIFWAIKCFILGGVSFYEINEAKDPSKLNEKEDPSNRKSKSCR
mmetsp:Transcript_16656/g.16748  ORF Transcript_16656/g.16748 Transcript_16656/m.16748 type:complete len:330 (+) Transcript_16656:108-1097(+)